MFSLYRIPRIMIRKYCRYAELLILLLTCVLIHSETGDGEWHGKFFPYGPGEQDKNPLVSIIGMPEPNNACDDGKVNLTRDWDGSPVDHTCYLPRNLYRPDVNIQSTLICEHIPKHYSAIHVCMNISINYDADIPTYGAHRPLWARYGEYKYLPRQRWLHNLEHGAIVVLYHPCANKREVYKLIQLVRGCLFRHIITPDLHVTAARPLVLVSWGCRLEMSVVDFLSVTSFIRSRALTGPEQLTKDGQFDDELMIPAQIVSDVNDTQLCSLNSV